MGAYAAQAGINVLICVGTRAKEMVLGAKEALETMEGSNMQIFYYPTKEEMLPHLLELVRKGDTILVKASHFMEFPKVVERLLEAKA